MANREEKVYRWFERNADADGFVEVGCPTVAHGLKMPVRTVQGVVSRLEKQGKIYLIGYRRFAVTSLVE